MNKFYKDDITRLEQLINYQFKNPELIFEALSHPSLKQHESVWRKNYERFEILGDAILGFLITEMVFNIYNKSDEGGIAKRYRFVVKYRRKRRKGCQGKEDQREGQGTFSCSTQRTSI